jgi:hypothetical protein
MIDRRSFLTGLIAAPAVIRLATLMPILPQTMPVNLYRRGKALDGESFVVLVASFDVPIAKTGRIMPGFASVLRPDLDVGPRPQWAPISPIVLPIQYRGQGLIMSASTGPNLGPGRDYLSIQPLT